MGVGDTMHFAELQEKVDGAEGVYLLTVGTAGFEPATP